MKKFTLLLISLLMLSTLSKAQKKLCVHKLDGTRIDVLLSEVSYIDFEDVTTEPSDGPMLPEEGGFVAKPFSVSATKTVTFSPGNLQYHAANDEWRFALNQIDCIGLDNSNIGNPRYDGWIDLFGWGTGSNPINKSEENEDYYTFVDWGVNKIGDNAPNTWRTLTYNEWYYLCWARPSAEKLIGVAQVNGVNGLILLPDNWICPNGVTFKSGFSNSYESECYEVYQTISTSDWKKLEISGAIFFPANGIRYGSKILYNDFGYYWSATQGVYSFYFYCCAASIDDNGRHTGRSVRLVKD